MSRLDQLRKLAEAQPDDPFAHYAVGLEYAEQSQWAAAQAAFARALEINADYTAAYMQRARAEIKLGRREDAGATLRAGLAVAGRLGDQHAVDELTKMLEAIS